MAHADRPDERRGVSVIRRTRRRGRVETVTASRVPRSRAQMTAVALLALGSVALIGWTVVSLVSKPEGGRALADAAPATVSLVRWRCHQPDRCDGLGPPNEVPGGKTSQVRRTPSAAAPFAAQPRRDHRLGSTCATALGCTPIRPRVRGWNHRARRPTVRASRRGDARRAASGAAPIERKDDETSPRSTPGTSRGARGRRRTRLARRTRAPSTSDEASPAPPAPEESAPSAPAPPTAP